MRQLGVILIIMITSFIHPVIPLQMEHSIQKSATSIGAAIELPISGQVAQGSVVIRGTASTNGFDSYEVDFTYSQNLPQTWFLILESTTPVQNGILAVWDTTTITDGDYNLRLLINNSDGSQSQVLINDLRVRNYTAIETETPNPIISAQATSTSVNPIASSFPSNIILAAPTPAPTAMPKNPVEISDSQLALTFGIGAAIAVGLFMVLGTYIGIRNYMYNRK